MATVIYQPPDYGGTSPGKALGMALGTAVETYAQKEEQRKKTEQVQKAIEGIQKSPNRAAALELGASIPFEDPKDIATFYSLVDKFHPARDNTPKEIKFTGPDGKPNRAFVPQSDLFKLNSPEGISAVLGEGAKLSTGETKDFYQVGPEGLVNLGQFDVSNRPAGAVTLEEFQTQERIRSGKRADEAAVRSETRLDLAIRQAEASLEAANRGGARDARTAEHQRVTQELSAIRAANNLLKERLPGGVKKVLDTQGNINLDFGGDADLERKYQTASDILPDMLQKHGVTNFNKAVTAALKQAGILEADNAPAKKPEAPVKVPKKESGILDRVLQHNKETLTGKPAAKTPAGPTYKDMQPADRSASIANAKAFLAANPDKKQLVIKRLRDAGFPDNEIQGLGK